MASTVQRYYEEKRERWLSDDELCRLCVVLESHQNERAANAIRLQVLTGARLGEFLVRATKTSISIERGVWTKPAHETKQKRTEHLRLSAQALVLVASVIEVSDPNSPFLFPGNKPGQPLREIKKFWAAVLRQAGDSWEATWSYDADHRSPLCSSRG
jgi:integrase